MKLIKKYYISNLTGHGFTGGFADNLYPRFMDFDPHVMTLTFDSEYAAEEYVVAHEQFMNYTFFIDSFYQAVEGERNSE